MARFDEEKQYFSGLFGRVIFLFGSNHKKILREDLGAEVVSGG